MAVRHPRARGQVRFDDISEEEAKAIFRETLAAPVNDDVLIAEKARHNRTKMLTAWRRLVSLLFSLL